MNQCEVLLVVCRQNDKFRYICLNFDEMSDCNEERCPVWFSARFTYQQFCSLRALDLKEDQS